jgi:hypothetical protein
VLTKKLILFIALGGALLVPGIAEAGREAPPTQFEIGLSFEGGAFGIGGDYAQEQRAEGGGVFRVPLHVRVGDWEGSAHFFLSGGVADNDTFDHYSTNGFGASAKRYLSLSAVEVGRRYRPTFLRLDAYVRGGIDRLSVNRPESTTATAFSYGLGLKFRLQAGKRRGAKVSYGFYLDLGRMRPLSGPQQSSTLQTITFGLTLLGVSV